MPVVVDSSLLSPSLLVLDDCILQNLINNNHIAVVVTVLNELEGLCRSRLATESRAALAFLREKNPQVRYVTSKGAPLPTLLAAGTVNEENDDQVRIEP